MDRKYIDVLTSSGIGTEPGRIAAPDGLAQPSSRNGPVPPDCHWRVQLIHDYWRLKQAESGVLPGYQHIDLREVPDIAPYIWLIDVAHSPARFRFHAIGDVIAIWAGEDNTGKWFDEVWPDYDPAVFIDVVESRQPSWCRGPSTFRPARREYEIERVRLPLASDGRTVDMILALSVFYDRHGREILPGDGGDTFGLRSAPLHHRPLPEPR